MKNRYDLPVRNSFVTSLMDYFKINEDVNLRAHINDLIRNVPKERYKDFFRRLTTSNMPYKNSYEKIAFVAAEYEQEILTPIELEAEERTDHLYHLMYDLRRDITLIRDPNLSALERFENVKFSSLKREGSENLLLDSMDLEIIKELTKKWVYDYVSFDRSLFESKVKALYRNAILERERCTDLLTITNPMLLNTKPL